ncbi:putative gustatory receptor 93c [Rhagoletis pomonella]|uniref:putative gustatory receptor 93c n=1 Tax=Rhagoletis pomonella TaxID=28610 RepID=UPI001784CEA5|nr:putative gustatory receptor 93c [Rhagoletis pomonella]
MPTKWKAKMVEIFLFLFYYTAVIFGVCAFTYRKRSIQENKQRLFNKISNDSTRTFTAVEQKWLTWCCAILRITSAVGSFYGGIVMWATTDPFYNAIMLLESGITATGSIALGIEMPFSSARFVNIANYCMRLFQRTRQLLPHKSIMGQQQFLFLLILTIFLCNDLSGLSVLLEYSDWRECALAFAKLYMLTGLMLSLYIGSIGYMSIGALYTFMNSYMREEFQPRARRLDCALKRNYNYRTCRYMRKLNRMTGELNVCLTLYNDIYRAAKMFHSDFRLNILFSLTTAFVFIVIIIYNVLYRYIIEHEFEWGAVIFCTQIFLMVLIVILSAYSAVQGNISASKLSLDSLYMGGNMEWNQSVEMFISRSNLYEFKPNMFGLFDISTDILLMFISGSITYLTYIMQNTIKLNQQ